MKTFPKDIVDLFSVSFNMAGTDYIMPIGIMKGPLKKNHYNRTVRTVLFQSFDFREINGITKGICEANAWFRFEKFTETPYKDYIFAGKVTTPIQLLQKINNAYNSTSKKNFTLVEFLKNFSVVFLSNRNYDRSPLRMAASDVDSFHAAIEFMKASSTSYVIQAYPKNAPVECSVTEAKEYLRFMRERYRGYKAVSKASAKEGTHYALHLEFEDGRKGILASFGEKELRFWDDSVNIQTWDQYRFWTSQEKAVEFAKKNADRIFRHNVLNMTVVTVKNDSEFIGLSFSPVKTVVV